MKVSRYIVRAKICLALVAITVLLTATTKAETVNITINESVLLPGGVTQTINGTGTFDTDTGLNSADIESGQTPLCQLCLIMPAWWVLDHLCAGNPNPPSQLPSLRDMSNNNIAVTFFANMGKAVGTVAYNITYKNDVATVLADFSHLDLSQVPTFVSPTTATSTEFVRSSAPGLGGSSYTFNRHHTATLSYALLGDPAAAITSRTVDTTDTATQTGPMSFSLSGQAIVSPVTTTGTPTLPEWSAILMGLALVLLATFRIRRSNVLRTA